MRPGTTLGERYTLGERLGSGDTGTVWAGHDTIFDRPVTVKILAPVLAEDDSLRERFRHVALSVADLSISGVVDVHDCLEERGDGGELLVCHVTERVAGRSLRELLTERGALPPMDALALIAGTARALHVAHGHGVVHGNLKPENLIVDDDGAVTIVDFGFLPPKRSAYTAPELSADSSAADVYGLGVIVYECLTGRVPAADGDISPLLNDFDPADAAPIMKAMSSPANGRFASAAAFADACEHLEPVHTGPAPDRETEPTAVDPRVPVAADSTGEPDQTTVTAAGQAGDGEPEPDSAMSAPAATSTAAAGPTHNPEPAAMPDVEATCEPDTTPEQTPVEADAESTVVETDADGCEPDENTAASAATGFSPDADGCEPDGEPREAGRSLPLRALVIGALVAVIAAVAVLLYVAIPTQPAGHGRPEPSDTNASDSPSQSPSPSAIGAGESPNSAQPAPTSSSPSPSDPPTSDDDDDGVQVPFVVGMRVESAQAELSNKGFLVIVNEEGQGRQQCRVHDQSPGGGDSAPGGATVTISVRRVNNPQQCIDPT